MNYEVERFLCWVDTETKLAKEIFDRLEEDPDINITQWRIALNTYSAYHLVQTSTYQFGLRQGNPPEFLSLPDAKK